MRLSNEEIRISGKEDMRMRGYGDVCIRESVFVGVCLFYNLCQLMGSGEPN